MNIILEISERRYLRKYMADYTHVVDHNLDETIVLEIET